MHCNGVGLGVKSWPSISINLGWQARSGFSSIPCRGSIFINVLGSIVMQYSCIHTFHWRRRLHGDPGCTKIHTYTHTHNTYSLSHKSVVYTCRLAKVTPLHKPPIDKPTCTAVIVCTFIYWTSESVVDYSLHAFCAANICSTRDVKNYKNVASCTAFTFRYENGMTLPSLEMVQHSVLHNNNNMATWRSEWIGDDIPWSNVWLVGVGNLAGPAAAVVGHLCGRERVFDGAIRDNSWKAGHGGNKDEIERLN